MASSSIDDIREATRLIMGLPRVIAVLLFGSMARGDATSRSDIDICVVAPRMETAKEKSELLGMIWRQIDGEKYDVRLFEELPLYMKMDVITTHVILHCNDVPALFEYFYFYRKIWADEAHRQSVSY
ncbi:MAG: nucleotidyltransferase domain-containing protein [Candidatus Thorarchaeota archaeon]